MFHKKQSFFRKFNCMRKTRFRLLTGIFSLCLLIGSLCGCAAETPSDWTLCRMRYDITSIDIPLTAEEENRLGELLLNHEYTDYDEDIKRDRFYGGKSFRIRLENEDYIYIWSLNVNAITQTVINNTTDSVTRNRYEPDRELLDLLFDGFNCAAQLSSP